MRPRKLRILRIDDRLSVLDHSDRRIPEQDVPPSEAIELLTFEAELAGSRRTLSAIDSWDIAAVWWEQFHDEQVPDLVVADIHFDCDQSSPLSNLTEHNHIPTGLMHLKPFAALARGRGAPLGVGIHTADADLWADIEKKDPSWQIMARLAAHEIGELAAILGHGHPPRSEGIEERIAWCWRWLRSRTKHDFLPALSTAIADYREKLLQLSAAGGVFVMPDEYAALLGWCDRQALEPAALDEAGDVGVVLTYRDGTRDCVSLASLFGDVSGVTERVLPERCFTGETHETPWKLDFAGRPRIGAFLRELGTLDRTYREAIKAIKEFPVELHEVQRNLRDVVDDRHGKLKELVRGLVVVFQALRRDEADFNAWRYAYETLLWDPRDLGFNPDAPGEAPTLRDTLQQLLRLIRIHARELSERGEGTRFQRAEVFEDYSSGAYRSWSAAAREGSEMDEAAANSAWARWHFGLLVDAGVLAYSDGRDEYQLVHGALEVPPAPPTAAKGLPGVDMAPQEYLMETLGFGPRLSSAKAKNWNAVGQLIQQAFPQPAKKSDASKAGRAFLERLRSGVGPAWLLELCRRYATHELEWRDRATWPAWLRA